MTLFHICLDGMLLLCKWITFDAKGLPVDFPETGYKWNQLSLLAQKFYSDYSELSYELLVAELQAVKMKLWNLLMSVPMIFFLEDYGTQNGRWENDLI